MLKGLLTAAAVPAEWLNRLAGEGLPWVQVHMDTSEAFLQALEWLGAERSQVLALVETDQQEATAKELGLACVGVLGQGQQLRNCEMLLEGLEEVDRIFLEEVHARAFGLPVKIAETKRLLLRELTLEDLEELNALYTKEERVRYFPEWSENRREEEERFAAYIRHMYGFCHFGLWAVVEKASGTLIGRAGFGIAEYLEEPEIDLGYFIGEAYRRQGYAKEACQAVLHYGQERLELTQISAYIPEENLSSRSLIQKLGFAKEREFLQEGRNMLRFVRTFD